MLKPYLTNSIQIERLKEIAKEATLNKAILPLVTVITPAYNRSSFLDETIASVLGQDYPNIEYIVLDDGSTDETLAVIKKYSDSVVWTSHPNMG